MTAGQPVVAGTDILDSTFNTLTADLATALSTCVTRDGQSPPTTNLPMGSFKLTGLAAGTAAGHSVRFEQLQTGVNKLITVAGTGDVITGVMTPTYGAYTNGDMFTFIVGSTNTTNVTINIDGLGAKAITNGTTALVAGALTANRVVVIQYDGTRFQLLSGADYLNTTRIDVASATTLDLTANAPSTRNIRLTGTTAITGVTVAIGQTYFVVASGAFTLTNNASIVTNTGANIVAAVGDSFMLRSTAANTVEVIEYASIILPVANGGSGVTTSTGTGANVLSTSPTLTTPTISSLSSASATALTLQSAGTTAITVDTSQNVGIGTSINSVYDQAASARPLVVQKSDTSTTVNGSTAAITIVNGDTTTNNTAQLGFAAITGASTNQYTSAAISCIFGARTNGQYSAGQLVFSTSTAINVAPAECMRIDSSGNLLVGAVSNISGVNGFQVSKNPGASAYAGAIVNTKTDNSTVTNGFLVKYTSLSPADSNYIFLCQDGGNTNRFFVLNNGTTGGTSDVNLKKNIETARNGYVEDLCKIRIVKYNWNQQPEETPKELGWIAQEIETVFPGMVGTDEKTGYKSVRHSVFVPMLIKAIQELKAIIDTQAARITALEQKA